MGKDLKGKELGVGFRQRTGGQFEANFTNRYSKRVFICDENLVKLRRKLSVAQYEDQEGIGVSESKVTVQRWSEIWLKRYKYNIRLTTKRNYLGYLKIINEFIGDMLLKDVKQMHVVEIVERMTVKGYKASTMRAMKSVAYNLFQKAYENDFLRRNPVVGIQIRSNEEKKVKVLTVEEQKIFLESIESSHYREMFNLMLLTGLRIGETLGLSWSDIDWQNRKMHISRDLVHVKEDGEFKYMMNATKTISSRRVLPLNEEAIYFLKEQKAKGLNRLKNDNLFDDLIFLKRDGGISSFTNINRLLHYKVKAIRNQGHEIQNLSAHMLRHTFATRCFESGMSLLIISRFLGHKRIEMTADIYTHVLPDNAANEMGKFRLISSYEQLERSNVEDETK